MTAQIIQFPQLSRFETKITSGSFYTRVIEKIRKDSYGKPVYDFSVKTMLVYCEDAGRCLRVPVISTEGEYRD